MNYFGRAKVLIDPPPAPLKKGGEFSSSPFLRGIEGDLFANSRH